jgi:hypothetical protein
LLKDTSRDPDHGASGLLQAQKCPEVGRLYSGLERSDKGGNSALRPTCAPKRKHQEQKDLKWLWIYSGLERSDKKEETTDPLGRATGPF